LGIFTVKFYRKVRLSCSEGMSQQAAAQHFGIPRDSARKMLALSVPAGYRFGGLSADGGREAAEAGHSQADFGEAVVFIDGVEQKAHFFIMDLPHSDDCFVRAYPAATAGEAV
jgi:hypothetical protein